MGDARDVEVIEICVASGDTVSGNDALIVVESEKASMEVPSPSAGTIESIEVELGATVNSGDVIAVLASQESEFVESRNVTESAAAAKAPAEASSPDPQPTTHVVDDTTSLKERELQVAVISVPDIGDAKGVIVVEILVKAGDSVAIADPLVVIESEKASMEIPSPIGGEVSQVHVELDQVVSKGTEIASIKTLDVVDHEDGPDPQVGHPPRVDNADQEASAATVDVVPEDRQEEGATERTLAHTAEPVAALAGQSVYAGPAVRKLAREMGVDLRAVKGSGARGRIVKDDVKSYVKDKLNAGPRHAPVDSPPELPDFSLYGETEILELTRMEARGARNLSQSWRTIPHVTEHDEVDVTDLETFRKTLNAERGADGVKVTPLAFLIKVCAVALKQFPKFNGSIDPSFTSLVIKKYWHIGVAVDTPAGLIVPVVKDANAKGILQIAEEVRELASLAQARRLVPDQLSGATFTISSLGALGGRGFTPIINPPEVAILGVSRMVMKPVWDGTSFQPRRMLPLSLSYDHRAINGAEAARFMQTLTLALADIRRLTL